MYKILIVDDEPEVRSILIDVLEYSGLEIDVHEAGNGEEALESIRKDKFDLLLLDLKMPKMTGDDLLRAIRAEVEEPMPVIVVSGHLERDVIREIWGDGAFDFIHKVEAVDELEEAVKKAIHFGPHVISHRKKAAGE